MATITDHATFTQNLINDIREHGRPTSGPMEGRPVMILHTIGAKTGAERETPVTYTRDGNRYVIAASKGGAPTNPAWYHNLVAHPATTIETDRETVKVRASEVTGPERERLWEQHAAERPEFRDYPNRTDRVIPVLTLERLG